MTKARDLARLQPDTSGKLPTTNLGAGSVLQVVQSMDTGVVFSTTSTYANTGLSASIVPKFATSKILVIVYQGQCTKTAADAQLNLRLRRGSTTIFDFSALNHGASTTESSNVTISFLDSPGTTSSTTYSTQLANRDNSGTMYTNVNGSATITLMEIAA